ncbi:MAG: ABC transporter permease [Spirochaetes bacterium]|nr:ABC transporter permease [Spirochaetota bacterium]
MEHLFSIFNQDLFAAMIRLATPIILASVGAVICERAGIVNIAIEGIMIMGAFFASYIAFITGNPWVGMLGGIFAGGIFSLLHALFTITFHLDHVVSGAVLNILAFGLARYFLVLTFGHPGQSDPIRYSLGQVKIHIPILYKIPFLGKVFFDHTPIIYITFIVIFIIWFLLYKTKIGLHIRAAGEHAIALETLGIPVIKIKYLAVFISGLTAGLSGAYLSIENSTVFSEGMTGGRGFIALAAMISGGWNPLGATLASLFFGLAEALQYKIQSEQILFIPKEFFLIFPYVATVIVVAGLVRKSRPPKEVGKDFIIEKEEE